MLCVVRCANGLTVINLGYALYAALGSLFALQGRMAVGDVQAMLQYSRQFSQPFTQLAAMAGGLAAAMAAAERIFDLLDAPEQEIDPTDAVQPSTRDGRVSFKHVRFGYDPDNALMHDVSFTVEPGQKVAIVGHTGAGKTTLVNKRPQWAGGGFSRETLSAFDAYYRWCEKLRLPNRSQRFGPPSGSTEYNKEELS